MKRNKGFTLIELLVVIAIIGVLSSVVLASLNTARRKSRDSKRISDIKNIQLALEMYFDSNNSYPGGAYTDMTGALVGDNLLPSTPADPITGNTYYYSATDSSDAACAAADTDCTNYSLSATLEETSNGVLASDAAGDENTTCGGTEGAPDGCYDVSP